jgi:hypothetical protein
MKCTVIFVFGDARLKNNLLISNFTISSHSSPFINFGMANLTGQLRILAGHCPLTGRYFAPWKILTDLHHINVIVS